MSNPASCLEILPADGYIAAMDLFTRHPDGSYRAYNAVVISDVTIGEDSNFWFHTVVRGDVAPIVIGRRVNLQDLAIIHADTGVPVTIEDDVSIGHAAVVHGQFVGEGSLIGIRAVLLSRCRIGRHCIVAAGSVVTPDTQIPDGQMVMGTPAKVVRPLTAKELQTLKWTTGRYLELAKSYIGKSV